MKILFLNDGDHSDYITDGLIHGLRLNGNYVMDYPKRKSLYKNETSYYSVRGLWQGNWEDDTYEKDRDDYHSLNVDSYDLIICDNPQAFFLAPLLAAKRKHREKVVCLLTNDPITRAPLPNVRMDKVTPMAIKEKCLQIPEVNVKTINDFPINHLVLEEDCNITNPNRNGVLFSMSLNNPKRIEYSQYFENKKFKTKEDYFYALRKSKYAVSIYADGYNCQRDPEIAGNTVLCKLRRSDWVYDESSYTDGITCIEFSSIDELRRKLTFLDNNPELYNKLLRQGYEHTLKYYGVKSQANKFLEWCKNVRGIRER